MQGAGDLTADMSGAAPACVSPETGVKVSVIIPVYNAAAYLDKCLTSVLSQDLRELEVLCVDDVSQDASSELLERFASHDSRVVHLKNDSNRGAAYCRNLGIQKARGEYVAFMDADDLYPECGTLRALLTAAEDHGMLIAGGEFSYLNRNSRYLITATSPNAPKNQCITSS